MLNLIVNPCLKRRCLLLDLSKLIEYVLEYFGFDLSETIHTLQVNQSFLYGLRAFIVRCHLSSLLVHPLNKRVNQVVDHLTGFHLDTEQVQFNCARHLYKKDKYKITYISGKCHLALRYGISG